MINKDEWLNMPEPTEDPTPEYIILKDPDKEHREAAWRIAIGLQDVDHLRPSEYLIDVANKNIAGDITSKSASKMIEEYHQKKRDNSSGNRTTEADLVAARINELLQSDGFTFSVGQFLTFHEKLFHGIYKFAGKIRDYDIQKAEWVLNGESVNYGISTELKATLEYDIEQESKFKFDVIEEDVFIKHMARFVSNLWQIHVFGEGNTRTTALFFIKYLYSLNIDYINNDMFEKYSWYFRNALVRANYNNPREGIQETTYYLEQFLRNLILGEHNELHNRDIHVNNIDIAKSLNIEPPANNQMTMYELRVLDILKDNPNMTQDEIAEKLKRSVRTIKSITKSLQEKGALKRENGKRFGYWVVKI